MLDKYLVNEKLNSRVGQTLNRGNSGNIKKKNGGRGGRAGHDGKFLAPSLG